MTTTAEDRQSITKRTAIEIAFGKIQGIVEELKDEPSLKLNPIPVICEENPLTKTETETNPLADSKLKRTEASAVTGFEMVDDEVP